jgi:hypothetical protein
MLEERLRHLESKVNSNVDASSQLSPPQSASLYHQQELQDMQPPKSVGQSSPDASVQAGETPEQSSGGGLALGVGLLSSCAVAEPHYFGSSAGLSLAHFVQVAIDIGGSSADLSLPMLADRPFSSQAPNAKTSPAPLPSFKTGARYIRAYLSNAHPLYPFLNRRSLWDLHKSHTQSEGAPSSPTAVMDLALLHLVYAIGGRCLQLLGRSKHSRNTPEGHFHSAMKIINDGMKFTSIRSIEMTLLLAIHSMRSPSGKDPEYTQSCSKSC